MGKFVGIGCNKGKTVHMYYALEYAMAISSMDKQERDEVVRWHKNTFPESMAMTFDKIKKEIMEDVDEQFYFIDWWFSGSWNYYDEEDEQNAAE